MAATGTNSNSQTSIVDRLVSKFGLNKADVQKVFDEDRATHQAERQAAVNDKLAQLVKDGKLTQDQADKLTAKAKELADAREANRGKFKDMTDAERKAAIDKERDAIKTWLNDNKIDDQYARFVFGGGHLGPGGPGMGGMGHFDDQPPADSN